MVAFDDNGKIDILGLLPDELEAEILKLGEKKFRAGQIFDWLHVKRVSSFDEMTNLSVQLRNLLNEKFCLKSLFFLQFYIFFTIHNFFQKSLNLIPIIL